MQRDNWTLLKRQRRILATRKIKTTWKHTRTFDRCTQYGYPYLAVHPYLLTVHPQKVHSAIVLSFVHLTV